MASGAALLVRRKQGCLCSVGAGVHAEERLHYALQRSFQSRGRGSPHRKGDDACLEDRRGEPSFLGGGEARQWSVTFKRDKSLCGAIRAEVRKVLRTSIPTHMDTSVSCQWGAREAHLEEGQRPTQLFQRNSHSRLSGKQRLVILRPRCREAQLLHARRQHLLSGRQALLAESLRSRRRRQPLPRERFDRAGRRSRRSAENTVQVELHLNATLRFFPYPPARARQRSLCRRNSDTTSTSASGSWNAGAGHHPAA